MIVLGDQKTGKQTLIECLPGANLEDSTVRHTDCVAKLTLDVKKDQQDSNIPEKITIRIFKQNQGQMVPNFYRNAKVALIIFAFDQPASF